MKLRDYQQAAVEWAKLGGGLIIAPAGSGKTIIAAHILKHWMTNNTIKAGWLAPTRETCEQGHSAATLAGIGDRVTVRCPHESVDFSDCGILIVDEAKHSPAETWAKNIRSCPGIKFGFDATPWHDRDIERNAELRRMFPQTFEITREQVGESLADSRLIWRDDSDTGLQERIDRNIEKLMSDRGRYMRITKEELNAMCAWESIVDIGICQNTARNTACIEYANQNPDSQRLVLVPRVTLGEEYQRRIPGSLLLHSGVPRKPRREAVNAFRAGDLKCIVATSLADEGLDLPNAEILVMVSGGRSSQKTIQRASRVLRSFPGKKLATILDFADRFHPIAARQSQKRMASYKKLGCLIESEVKFVVTK